MELVLFERKIQLEFLFTVNGGLREGGEGDT